MMDFFTKENMVPVLLALASFAVIVIFWIALIEDTSSDRRVRMLERRRSDLRGQMIESKSRNSEATAMAKGLVEKLNLLPSDQAKGTTLELSQAGYRTKDVIFIYTFMRLVMPLAGAGLGFLLFYVMRVWDTTANNMLAGLLMTAIVMGLLPSVWLRNQKQKRMSALSKSLPDALDLFVICAEAGLSLDATFERVSQELTDAHPDLSDEFGLTSVELSFMPERAKALQALAERCPLGGVRSLVSTLVQTERYGTPLAVAMRVLSAEMRNERMMKAEEKAARLPAIMTVPMILFILPPLFVVLIGPAIIRTQDAFK